MFYKVHIEFRSRNLIRIFNQNLFLIYVFKIRLSMGLQALCMSERSPHDRWTERERRRAPLPSMGTQFVDARARICYRT